MWIGYEIEKEALLDTDQRNAARMAALKEFWQDVAPGQTFEEGIAIAALLHAAGDQFLGLRSIRRCHSMYTAYYKQWARRSGENPKKVLRRLTKYDKGHLRGLRRMGDVADFWLEKARKDISKFHAPVSES